MAAIRLVLVEVPPLTQRQHVLLSESRLGFVLCDSALVCYPGCPIIVPAPPPSKKSIIMSCWPGVDPSSATLLWFVAPGAR